MSCQEALTERSWARDAAAVLDDFASQSAHHAFCGEDCRGMEITIRPPTPFAVRGRVIYVATQR
jgi:hypothetical protein